MSVKVVKSRHPKYEKNNYLWRQQELALEGGHVWINECLTRHPYESANRITPNQCLERFENRKRIATNPVQVLPAVQKVQSSAQGSASGFDIKVDDEYIHEIISEDIDGNGSSAFSWLTNKPLFYGAGNGLVYLGIEVPAIPPDMETVTQADMRNGRVAPPKWFYLKASDVLNWVEKDGDIYDGQFSRLMYKTSYPVMNSETGFYDFQDAIVLYTDTEIITYNDTGRKILNHEENSLGFVPIVSVDLGQSLINEGVDFSRTAIEINSYSLQNQIDSFFNFIVARGFKMQSTDEEGNTQVVHLASGKVVSTPEKDNFLEFISPDSAVASETREQINALQNQLDSSVQQAHTNFARSGATLGSGVAYKELGSYQAQSVKYIMDSLLDKFKVTVYYALSAISKSDAVVEMKKPESYNFETQAEAIDQAEALDALSSTALSKESKKAINALKIKKLVSDSELRGVIIDADNDAIDSEVPTSTI